MISLSFLFFLNDLDILILKQLLILGGGFLQIYVIKRAKELGYYVHVLDGDSQARGYKYADKYEVIDIKDEEECLRYARENNIDGVLTAATDFSVLSVSRISSELHLPGINYKSATLIKNKASVRKCLFDAKADDTGYSFEISSLEDIPDVLKIIHFPVMVKPCDGSGSRGASRVDKAEDFEQACIEAMNASSSHRVVAEPFVPGKEYGVESYVDQDEIRVLAVMQKEMTEHPYYAELGHAIPSGLSSEMECKVINCVKRAIMALGVNRGSVNMDILIGADGDVHIVDVGARMGGNLIGSHIVPLGTGIDYMGNMIKAAVGDPTDWGIPNSLRPVATKLLALTPGVIQALPDFDAIEKQYGVKIEHHLKVGDVINEYHTNLDGCGYVVATADNVDAAIQKAAFVKKLIDRSIERE